VKSTSIFFSSDSGLPGFASKFRGFRFFSIYKLWILMGMETTWEFSLRKCRSKIPFHRLRGKQTNNISDILRQLSPEVYSSQINPWPGDDDENFIIIWPSMSQWLKRSNSLLRALKRGGGHVPVPTESIRNVLKVRHGFETLCVSSGGWHLMGSPF